MEQDKTPQNINALVSEIGEKMILFRLFTKITQKPHLEIFKNYSEPGFDIGVRNNKNADKVKIEVKTRQHIVTTTAEKSKGSCHFTLTENEWKYSDFLVGYWIDYNDFFIVPISKLKATKSNGKTVYKLVFSRLTKPINLNIYSEHVMEFLNNWNLILLLAENKAAANTGLAKNWRTD